ncbi:hypothetical protein RchiOBHm_Chr1g0348151 [Rosa chinensis]|uniref:Uncharacterized protein n=1 Tax=Rosa chinensis TaxID=74649 RepID=A0A2P6SFG5_ROSCH|nr:hypothetical protein RchiOBHm_Chr1g0348151 [Rosa chinensis]
MLDFEILSWGGSGKVIKESIDLLWVSFKVWLMSIVAMAGERVVLVVVAVRVLLVVEVARALLAVGVVRVLLVVEVVRAPLVEVMRVRLTVARVRLNF